MTSHFEPIPDHILEAEPGLEWVECPDCEGGWLEHDRSGWLPPGSRIAMLRPELCRSFARCPRCRGWGEVLVEY